MFIRVLQVIAGIVYVFGAIGVVYEFFGEFEIIGYTAPNSGAAADSVSRNWPRRAEPKSNDTGT